jgi:GntR family transcriptional regulator, transcriptional repressor for pyruvate dehydrogenase complex
MLDVNQKKNIITVICSLEVLRGTRMPPKPKAAELSTLSAPIKKRSVVHYVIDKLKEAMILKELKRGDYLPSESELTRQLGVGKTSVREALKQLAAMGIVEIRQGHGTFIPLDPVADAINPLIFQMILEQATNEDLMELRMMFEPAYALIAMQKAGPKQISSLQESVEQFERKIRAGIHTAEDDLAFHEQMLECTGNPYIVRIGTTIHQLFKTSVSRSMRSIPETALHDHKAILAAFLSRDQEKLIAAIRNSHEGWARSLRVSDGDIAGH